MQTKVCKFLAAALAICCIFPLYTSAKTGAYNWYFSLKNGYPETDSDYAFIDSYDGYFYNKAANAAKEKVIYLTFDAGYENGNVERILDTLKKHSASGTFFVLEHLIANNTDLVMRMVNEGHDVANHTAHHPDMTKKDECGFCDEIKKAETVLYEKTGKTMAKFYRPPQGRFSKENLKAAKKLGYKTIFWSFAYADWDNDRQPAADYAYRKITSATHPGEIILLHPTSKTNADILDDLLTFWENEGYRFGKLSELGE